MKKLLIPFFMVYAVCLNGQERIPADLRNGQFYINILEPSLSYEMRLADMQSLLLTAGLSTLGEEDINEDFALGLIPMLQLDFRHYYPRKKVKKELRPNSGNFVGLVTGYNFASIADNLDFGEFDDEKAFFLGPVWGIQRNYQSGIHLSLILGGGFITGSNTDFDAHGIISFELGFVIGGK